MLSAPEFDYQFKLIEFINGHQRQKNAGESDFSANFRVTPSATAHENEKNYNLFDINQSFKQRAFLLVIIF
ncbi:MAG: hypothetical protein RLZZ419_343 [Pseudomonadota bacterium]|jgi:hypothetical protein